MITGHMVSKDLSTTLSLFDHRTHHEKALDRLRDGRSHNSGEFYRKDNIGRISERVRELVAMGYDIVNINKNEDGNCRGGVAWYVWNNDCVMRKLAEEMA